MLGSARLEKSDKGASPYEEELKEQFIKAYNTARIKHRRQRGRKITADEFESFNRRFAKRWDAKYMTRFADYVKTDFDASATRVQAFDFTGRVL